MMEFKSNFIDFPSSKFNPVVICGKDWGGKGDCNKKVREAEGSVFRILVIPCLDVMAN